MATINKIKHASPKLFLYLAAACAILAIIGLRQNNLKMVELRTELYAADKRGTGVDQALNKLRAHVYGHMNANLASGNNAIKPPIQLKYTYERLLKAEQARVNQANDAIHRAADAYCRRTEPGEEFRQVLSVMLTPEMLRPKRYRRLFTSLILSAPAGHRTWRAGAWWPPLSLD
jgi:hypothetical protein